MKANEIIIHTTSTKDKLEEISNQAFKYALISLPFTIDRMRIGALKQRLLNIYKGKMAEGLLEDFSTQNGLAIDFKSGETPFWKRDLFDFSYRLIQWDLKNNFTLGKGIPKLEEYLDLPALVPNRYEGDQWSRAIQASDKGFLFSFISQESTPEIRDITLSSVQLDFITSCAKESTDLEVEPYRADWFFSHLKSIGKPPEIKPPREIELVITAYADHNSFQMFMDTDGIENFNYSMYKGKWYKLDAKRRLVFRDGLIRTRIKNATCPIAALPSFSSLLQAF